MESEGTKASFVGFKTTPDEHARYHAAAKERGVSLSSIARTALDGFFGQPTPGVARNAAEATLLASIRGSDPTLPGDLARLAAACEADADVRKAIRHLASALAHRKGARSRATGRRRKPRVGG